MATSNQTLGLGGLHYPLTQISLAVNDLGTTMDRYYQAFGWAPWQVFDHVLPVHHNTQLRGQPVDYSLRGAEVYVGKLNFELLQPLQGPNLWSEFISQRGEGIASIATMFHDRQDGDEVKLQFQKQFGIPVSMKADIGDHIEYYYLATEAQFGMMIESGSGHAIDFVSAAQVYPSQEAEQGPAPSSGISYPAITQVSAVTDDLEASVRKFHLAFGWGPWNIYDSSKSDLLQDCTFHGHRVPPFKVRWAQTMVDDTIRLALFEPIDADNPWQELLERQGPGLFSISVMFDTDAKAEGVKESFAESGVSTVAGGRVGDRQWFYLDSQSDFKCLIESGSGHALDWVEPTSVFPEVDESG